MNSDLLISLLVETNWLFPVGWLLVLVAAFLVSFPEKLSVTHAAKRRWQNLVAEEYLKISPCC